MIRHIEPLDTFNEGALATGEVVRRFGAWRIVWVAPIDDAVTRAPFVAHEDKGARTDRFGHLRGGGRLRDAFRHNEGRVGRLRQRVEHHAPAFLEADLEGLVIHRGDRIGYGGHLLAHDVAAHPTT